MSEMPPILYFGNDWFADDRTSSHHVARQLARRTKVSVFRGARPAPAAGDVARHPADRPQADTRARPAFRRRRSTGGAHGAAASATRLGVRSRTERLCQQHLRGDGGAARGDDRSDRLVHRASRGQLRAAAAAIAAVYHCIDDYSALPGVDARAVRMMDDSLTRDADLVVAASGPVFAAKQRLNESTLLMPHGVDVAHFGRAQSEELRRPEDLPVQRPIVGFVGLIEQWIDLELVAYLAENIPEATFVMIGRIAVPAAAVPSRPNLLFLGPRPYESLPAYGRFFDAAIIPYKLTDQVIAANPLKLREYLAMGLPTVSVSTPEIDQFADVVSVNRTREDFLCSLRSALATPSTDDAIRRRMRAVADVSWESRVAGLLTHIDTLIQQRDNGSRNLEAIAR